MPFTTLTALPAFNEANHIGPVLDQVCKFATDVIVVDDGSTDGTTELLSRRDDVRTLSHETNYGYGGALQTAFDYAFKHNYDVLVTIDCDGQHQPRLIPELAAAVYEPLALEPVRFASAPFDDGPADVVSGSRYLQQFEGAGPPPEDRRRINVEITRTINDRLGLNLTDAFCGFKAYRVDALQCFKITELGYAMPLQLWVQAAAAEMRIIEFPVPLVYLEEERSFGGSLDDSQRRLAYYREVIEREMAEFESPCTADV